ncbi:MAG: hypothetical protein ACK5Y6_02315 [Pseudomonadota bacterium]|jgi:uncharacterized membrane protein YeaQ/YmgE (transglycosylase-associated protein family)
MDMTTLLVQVLSGAVGGNLAGKTMKNSNLGTLGNSLAGILGGGLGGQILASLGASAGQAAASGLSLESIVSNVAGGGVGGAVLLAIIGIIKKFLAAQKQA